MHRLFFDKNVSFFWSRSKKPKKLFFYHRLLCIPPISSMASTYVSTREYNFPARSNYYKSQQFYYYILLWQLFNDQTNLKLIYRLCTRYHRLHTLLLYGRYEFSNWLCTCFEMIYGNKWHVLPIFETSVKNSTRTSVLCVARQGERDKRIAYRSFEWF